MSVEKNLGTLFLFSNQNQFLKELTTMKTIQNAIKTLKRRYCLEILRS